MHRAAGRRARSGAGTCRADDRGAGDAPATPDKVHRCAALRRRAAAASARQRLLDAATRRIDELYPVWPGHRPLLDRLRGTYQHRSEHVDRQLDASAPEEDRELIEHREIKRTVIDSEREALLRLRAEGEIDDQLLRELERELDLEERRMDA